MHVQQAELATIAFLERNPKDFDNADLLKLMFLKVLTWNSSCMPALAGSSSPKKPQFWFDSRTNWVKELSNGFPIARQRVNRMLLNRRTK